MTAYRARPGVRVWTVSTVVTDPVPNRAHDGSPLPGGEPGHVVLDVALRPDVDVHRVVGRLRAAVEQLDVDLRTEPT